MIKFSVLLKTGSGTLLAISGERTRALVAELSFTTAYNTLTTSDFLHWVETAAVWAPLHLTFSD